MTDWHNRDFDLEGSKSALMNIVLNLLPRRLETFGKDNHSCSSIRDFSNTSSFVLGSIAPQVETDQPSGDSGLELLGLTATSPGNQSRNSCTKNPRERKFGSQKVFCTSMKDRTRRSPISASNDG
ncbi:hypothetical protein Nepgr_014077 [Nepenthes gracilis]|uniref:Uncharacterized protein n=1 Tax=Nepenthes gracilis TaxID=150966 RepID=A0AAD3SKV7_NEPGR|nr:hypothetical protein Nepgr_014077 [Nepenthes gracilis]